MEEFLEKMCSFAVKISKHIFKFFSYMFEKIYIILKELEEEEQKKQNIPIQNIEYFDTLVRFLLDNSNNHSGIDFYTRLENVYLNIIEADNKERKLIGEPVYVPHPNFALELQYVNIAAIRNIINNNFLQLIYDNTSLYKISIQYKLDEKENNNIQDTEYIKNIFNNYCHNMMIFPKLPIFCTEVAKENRYLVFTFIHYGKHKETKTKEIDFHDEDFY